MGKITMLAAGAAGYVLGARAGRERYEQIVSQARSVWGDPRVQARKDQAASVAKDTAQSAKVTAQDKAGAAKQAVQDKVSSDEDSSDEDRTTSSVGTSSTTATPVTPDFDVPTPDAAFGGTETPAFPVDPGEPGAPGRHV